MAQLTSAASFALQHEPAIPPRQDPVRAGDPVTQLIEPVGAPLRPAMPGIDLRTHFPSIGFPPAYLRKKVLKPRANVPRGTSIPSYASSASWIHGAGFHPAAPHPT